MFIQSAPSAEVIKDVVESMKRYTMSERQLISNPYVNSSINAATLINAATPPTPHQDAKSNATSGIESKAPTTSPNRYSDAAGSSSSSSSSSLSRKYNATGSNSNSSSRPSILDGGNVVDNNATSSNTSVSVTHTSYSLTTYKTKAVNNSATNHWCEHVFLIKENKSSCPEQDEGNANPGKPTINAVGGKRKHLERKTTTNRYSKPFINMNQADAMEFKEIPTEKKYEYDQLFVSATIPRILPTRDQQNQLIYDFAEVTGCITKQNFAAMDLGFCKAIEFSTHTSIQNFYNFSRLRRWVDSYSRINVERRLHVFQMYADHFTNIINRSNDQHSEEKCADS